MTISRASLITTEQMVNDIRQHVGHFDPNGNRRMGDADSAHQVIFGWRPGYGDVVAKPFTKYQRGLREMVSLETVALRGFDAIEPLQLARGGLATYLFTRRLRELRHLGQFDWNANIASPRLRTSIAPTLTSVADALSSYHNAGIVHGDYQAKNAMFGPDGRPIYGDAEKTWIDAPVEPRTAIANRDVGLFGVSVLARGLLHDRSASYRAGYLGDQLLDPYFAATDPANYNMTPQERQAAITDYWVGAIQRGYTPSWVTRQTQPAQPVG